MFKLTNQNKSVHHCSIDIQCDRSMWKSHQCQCTHVHSYQGPHYTHLHLNSHNNTDDNCNTTSTIITVPLHVLLSVLRRYPSLQAHIKDDSVLIHWCWQPPLLTVHSSVSEESEIEWRGMTVLNLKHYNFCIPLQILHNSTIYNFTREYIAVIKAS